MWFLQKFFSSDANNNFDIKPVIKYNNADADKANIFADNRKKIGIYRWINNINGKTYVGSSNNLNVRFYTYYSLRSLAKSNRPMERALLKYGFSNFSLEILEYCKLEDLLKREQYYMDRLKPEYNIVTTAGSTLGYKHTEESLNKMRNFILSDEVLNKKKLSTKNATKARSISIQVENIKTGEKSEYVSLTEAGKAIGVSKAAVSQAILNKRILKKTYIIEKKRSYGTVSRSFKRSIKTIEKSVDRLMNMIIFIFICLFLLISCLMYFLPFFGESIVTLNENKDDSSDLKGMTSGLDLNKFIDNSTSSPLENILFDIEAISYICLSFVLILIIQILFKFYIKDNITLPLSNIFGLNINNKLEFYLNKIIKLNKQINNIYIWLILIMLIVGLSLAGYGSGELYNNLDTYIAVHNWLKNK